MKNDSLFKKIFASKQNCCAVDIEEVEETDEKVTEQQVANESESSCCSADKK